MPPTNYTEEDMRNAFTLGYIEGRVKEMGKVRLMNVPEERKEAFRQELKEKYRKNPLEFEFYATH